MGTRLFVGNLAFETREPELLELFSRVGTCVSAVILVDRETTRSRGFGFVEMESAEGAQRAIAELNGAPLNGRGVTVREARERTPGSAPGPRRPSFSSFGPDRAPAGPKFKKGGKSRRGARGRKRSL